MFRFSWWAWRAPKDVVEYVVKGLVLDILLVESEPAATKAFFRVLVEQISRSPLPRCTGTFGVKQCSTVL